MRRSIFPVATSRIAMSSRPSSSTMNANCLPSGDQAPLELMKFSASKCGSLDGDASFLMMRPVFASATYRSMLNRLRDEKNATYLPSGLITGDTFMSPILRPVCSTGWPASCGLVRPTSCGRVQRLVGRRPVGAQRVGRLTEHARDRVVESQAQRRTVDVHHRPLAPAPADVRPERLPVAIREEPRIGVQLLDRRERVAHHGVAHPHRRQRAVPAEREVLRHALDQPDRERAHPRQPVHVPVLRDVVLEHVHELVAEHVIVVLVDCR